MLEGYTDPEGDFLYIDNLSSSNALITEIYPEAWTITPNQIGFTGDLEISYTVNDEFGGRLWNKLN